MNTPEALDLFLNVWSNSLSSDDSGDRMCTPGMPGFRDTRRYWAKVWSDCVLLAEFLKQGQERLDAVSEVIREVPAGADGRSQEPD